MSDNIAFPSRTALQGRHNALNWPLVAYMVSCNVVGPKVKEARLTNQVTQEELATRLQILGWDIDRFGVSKIERRQREVIDKEVLLLAKALKVSITQLLVED